MDNRTLYDKSLYDRVFRTAEQIGIPVQTKSMVA